MAGGKVTSPTGTAPDRYVYYPGSEELGADEIRVVACGTGMPTARRSQAAASWVIELGNGPAKADARQAGLPGHGVREVGEDARLARECAAQSRQVGRCRRTQQGRWPVARRPQREAREDAAGDHDPVCRHHHE